MEVKKIFFDMDGVLADFVRGVSELAGCAVEDEDGHEPAQADSRMWKNISAVQHFYGRLKLMPGAKEMFDMVCSAYGDKCEILTAVPKPKRGMPDAREDKIRWVRRFLSKDIVIHVVYKEEKPDFCTGKDCILIDDYDCNIDDWENHGGTGILHKSSEETVKILKSMGIL